MGLDARAGEPHEVTVTLDGSEDPAEDLRRLEQWLKADDELAGLVGHRERSSDGTMGIGYDLVVQLLEGTLQATALSLLRCVYDHLVNRPPADDLTITIQTGDVRIVLTAGDTVTRGELEAKAAQVRRAIEG